VTEYPIKASIELKGLLRPALLMAYVKLNVYYFGKKHINSGTYVITQQVDDISMTGGFKTTLSLVRIAGDDDLGAADAYSAGPNTMTKAATQGAMQQPSQAQASKKKVQWTPPHTGIE
jgi:hypothetical protein